MMSFSFSDESSCVESLRDGVSAITGIGSYLLVEDVELESKLLSATTDSVSLSLSRFDFDTFSLGTTVVDSDLTLLGDAESAEAFLLKKPID